MTAALVGLLDRVRAATGPDRELDAEIICALLAPTGSTVEQSRINGAWCIFEPRKDGPKPFALWERCPQQLRHDQHPATASVDAALALVERCLPGKTVRVQPRLLLGGKYQHCAIEINDYKSGSEFAAENLPTAPLAILDVLLQALVAKEAKP